MVHTIQPIKQDADQLHEAIRLRRHFHKNPELGFAEFWTTREICLYLQALGYQIHFGKELYKEAYPHAKHISEIAKADAQLIDDAYAETLKKYPDDEWIRSMEGGFTGLIATLDCEEKGPTMGFRFDIDALPIKESSEVTHSPTRNNFSSNNSNMHACGHDGHTSIGLALAKQIIENKDQLKGKFVLVFQPSEEGPSGGEVFAKLHFFKQIDYFVPLHVGLVDERRIICGLSFLSLKAFKVTFKGKNAHAAVSPELGKNALLAACAAAMNIYSISRHGDGVSRMNIGHFHSENPSNVISDYSEFQLELRGQNNEICNFLHQRAEAAIQGAGLTYDVEIEIEDLGEYVMADNATKSVQQLKQAAIDVGISEEFVTERELTAGSEDASFMMNEVNRNGGAASYLCLGSPTFGGHHHPEFDFDEDMLIYGVNILWQYIQRLQPVD